MVQIYNLKTNIEKNKILFNLFYANCVYKYANLRTYPCR